MEENRTIRNWQKEYLAGVFDYADRKTQIKAGWYDWFCKDIALVNKTKKMGQIIKQITDGGKINLDICYVWFKNNCPLDGPLFDEIRFSKIDNGELLLSIQLGCRWNEARYAVLKTTNTQRKIIFKTNSKKELIKWLNTSY